MSVAAAPLRLSYSLVVCAPPRGSVLKEALRIHVQYASGRLMPSRERFNSAADAKHFVSRFYPDLIGKCTSVDEMNQPPSSRLIER